MKHNVIRYSMIVLLFGLVAMSAGRANAQGNQNDKQIELLSASWGIGPELTARFSVAHFGDGSVTFLSDTISVRIQILDMEGEVVVQSDEIKVEPGKIRFWDAPRDRLPAGEPNGRFQGRTRILVREFGNGIGYKDGKLKLGGSIGAALELFDPAMGRSAVSHAEFKIVKILDAATPK